MRFYIDWVRLMDQRSCNSKYYLTLIAALLAMLGPFSIDAYLPSFPAIESSFGVSRAVLSQSMGLIYLPFRSPHYSGGLYPIESDEKR
jgi:hypothetical protein